MMFTASKSRRSSGQGWLVLCLIIGVFIVLPLGLLGFDICRYSFASQQMRSAVDAAALSGVATLAASPASGDVQYAHEQAARDAWETFKKNSIFGYALTACPNPVPTYINNSPKPTTLSAAGMNVGDSRLYIDFLRPADRSMATPWQTDPDGKVMRLVGYFGYAPIFGQYLGFDNLLLRAGSDGAVPTLDIELCFDISGSMDDTTYVYLVNRMWVGNNTSNVTDPPGGGGPVITSQRLYHWLRAEGKIYDLFAPSPAGSRVNAVPPQNLRIAGMNQSGLTPFGYSQPSANRYSFSEKNWGFHGSQTRGLRCIGTIPTGTEEGAPPGNCDVTDLTRNSGSASAPIYGGFYDYPNGTTLDMDNSGPRLFTDIVVRIDGQTAAGQPYQSTSFTYPVNGQSYVFPNIATLVEASRGNLEDDTKRTNSMAAVSFHPVPAAQAGYKAAYYWAVENLTTQGALASGDQAGVKLYSPIGWSRDAAEDFVTMMKTNTDAHFGFAAFADTTGNEDPFWPPTVGGPYDRIDGHIPLGSPYKLGGEKAFEIPKIDLDQGNDHYNDVITRIGQLTPYGSTNIASALKTAVDDLIDTSKYRAGSKKVIVLFTDGVPNLPGDAVTAPDLARAQAIRARDNNIPIYTIGLATNGDIQYWENQLLDENPASGIAGISHPSAKYFLVTTASSLNDAFRVIARQLVQLTVQR